MALPATWFLNDSPIFWFKNPEEQPPSGGGGGGNLGGWLMLLAHRRNRNYILDALSHIKRYGDVGGQTDTG